jgi:hypothetical protein
VIARPSARTSGPALAIRAGRRGGNPRESPREQHVRAGGRDETEPAGEHDAGGRGHCGGAGQEDRRRHHGADAERRGEDGDRVALGGEQPLHAGRVSGGSDFLLHVAVPDIDALYAFVIDRLTERPEVADVNTSVVYEHIRRPVLEPLVA